MLSELAGELRAAREEHRRDVEQLRVDLAGGSPDWSARTPTCSGSSRPE
jgi:hypothetical protein